MSLLEIKNLRRAFYGLDVLRGVDLAVAAGGITGLIGPNGAGKTTLFNVVSGLVPPDAGSMRFDEKEIAGLAPDAVSRLGLVRTFQVARGFPRLSVFAIGFTAMFAVLRFPNFSVSGVATLGAFAGYLAYGAGLQMAGSLAVAFAVAGAAGLLFDKLAHLPLVRQGALPAAIASIASGLVLENVVRLGFGNEPRGFDRPIARDIRLGDIRVSPQQLETMALALALMLAVFAALAFTRIGKAMRASADNPELAALKGIRPERIAMMASFVGMGLVGVGGMLLGLDSSIDPLTGTRILLSIFAAAVLGGLGSAPGAVLGAFLIGIAEELSVLVVGSQYRAAVGFVAILAVLSLRPRGLLGERAF